MLNDKIFTKNLNNLRILTLFFVLTGLNAIPVQSQEKNAHLKNLSASQTAAEKNAEKNSEKNFPLQEISDSPTAKQLPQDFRKAGERLDGTDGELPASNAVQGQFTEIRSSSAVKDTEIPTAAAENSSWVSPCVTVRHPSELGYPWVDSSGIPEEEICFRGQSPSEPNEPAQALPQTLSSPSVGSVNPAGTTYPASAGNVNPTGTTYPVNAGNVNPPGTTYPVTAGSVNQDGTTYPVNAGNVNQDGTTYPVNAENVNPAGSTYPVNAGNVNPPGTTYPVTAGNVNPPGTLQSLPTGSAAPTEAAYSAPVGSACPPETVYSVPAGNVCPPDICPPDVCPDSTGSVCPPGMVYADSGLELDFQGTGSADVGWRSSQGTVYSPEEEQYHYWDSTFRASIPGLGRPLPTSNQAWSWQFLPSGTLYRAHFASNRESRLGIHFISEDTTHDSYWDPTLGGRINFLRYGTESRLYPEGFQWDLECAAIARLTLTGDRDLHGTDYRVGSPLTFRKEHWEFKVGYYHISSHMGDEWIVKNYAKTGEVYRINYVRDCLTWGIAFRPDANWRFYFGGDYVFNCDGGAKPWQFELGAEYSPMMLPNFQGSPFLALHFRWSEDTDFETYSALEAGWQWKTLYQRTLRTGLYAMAGHADQYQFYDRWEKQIGMGLWYDF